MSIFKKIGGWFNDITGASESNAWMEDMSNTSHQREMADLEAAGLNPALTATGGAGASTPSASSGNSGMSGLSGLINSGSNLGVAIGTIRKQFADASNAEAQAEAQRLENDLKKRLIGKKGDGSGSASGDSDPDFLDNVLNWSKQAGQWLGEKAGQLIGNGLGYGTPTEDLTVANAYQMSVPTDPREAQKKLQLELFNLNRKYQTFKKQAETVKDPAEKARYEKAAREQKERFDWLQKYIRNKYRK